jgi:hypothetical protein
MTRGSALVGVVVLLLGFGPCKMSDEEIRKATERVGGIDLGDHRRHDIEGPGGAFSVGQTAAALIPNPGIQITCRAQCQKYCWAQTKREEVDGKPISGYEDSLPSGAGPAARELARRQDRTKTSNGTAVDTTDNTRDPCWSDSTNRRSFEDFPNTGDSTFKGSTRLNVVYFETCVKCLQPPGNWLGCIRWAYVKVKNNEVIGADQRRLITLSSSQAPSSEFTEATGNWSR